MYSYINLYESGGWNNWEVIEIERRECIDNNDMAKRKYWLEQRGATLNKQVPSRTKSEYYVDNQENFKQYRADNKKKY
jgi:hypothetical protein